MVPFSSTRSNHIQYLIQNLNDSNSHSVFQELSQYLGYGIETSVLVVQTFLDYLDVCGKDLKNKHLIPVFTSIFKYILDKPNFSTVFCESLRSSAGNGDFLEILCNALQLSASEKIGTGLALSDSENFEIRTRGRNFCMAQIEELSANHMSVGSTEQIQNILVFLNQSDALSKHVDSFMQMLSLVQLKENFELILAPLLSAELRDANFLRNLDTFNESDESDFDAVLAEMEKEMSMADIMKELGYGCTVNVSECEEMFSLFLPLTEVTVAKIIGIIARTHVGLEDNQHTFLTFCSALGSSNVSDLLLLNSWNTGVLIDSIKQLAPGINWINVFENLDQEGFYIPNEAAFFFIMSIYRDACQDPFPLSAICGVVWKNAEGQLSFLKHAVSVPPEVFTFAHSERQLAYSDAVNGHKLQPGHANHAWFCLDLLEVLCQLAERGHASVVRSMIEYPLKNCPEVLLLGMADINSAYNLLQYEISSAVFPMILKSAVGNSIVLHLWNVNPNILLRGFIDALNMDPDHIGRVLDLCQELKLLSPVLDVIPFSFGIKLAVLASEKELIDLETWLSSNLSTYRDVFFEECLKFVNEVQFGAHDVFSNHVHHFGAFGNFYSETTCTFLKVLQAHTSLISSNQLLEEIAKLHVVCMDAILRMNSSDGIDLSISDGYAADIEAEANSYFHQMFSGQLTIDAMIQMLTKFKGSSVKRERSIFKCMLANLFEEYKLFSKYPERQLKIVAILFGALIKHQLVTDLRLGIALRVVLDSLQKPADSKMFAFGTKSLEQFVDRLIEWPQYCNTILQVSHLRGTHSVLVAFIERELARFSSGHSESDVGHSSSADDSHVSAPAVTVEVRVSSFPSIGSSVAQPGQQNSSPEQVQQGHNSSSEERHKASVTLSSYMNPVSSPADQPSVVPSTDAVSIQKACTTAVGVSATLASSPGSNCLSRSITSARFGSALDIETLVAAAERRETPVEAPVSEIQDKIAFLINNLSSANIEAKAEEFPEFLKEQYYPWFAQYIVMKRASIEPNFHDLYLKFLEKVNLKPLNKEIVQATYENCKVLLESELIKSSSEERSLLKNLGSWLGKLTIGRNQVLRSLEIDPKSLIIEAYEKGLMIAIIPFVSKILEQCQSSLAYRPPNPWTMAILGLLAEIYTMPYLKMNLKFDMEVLFKNLGVDLKDVTPTLLLKDRVREVDGNPDFSNKDVGSSTINQVELPLDVVSLSHTGCHILSQDDKLAALGLSDQLPSAQGPLQGKSPFYVGQFPAKSSSIDQQVIVNPNLQPLGLRLSLQRVLPIAMGRAIKEILSSTLQHIVSTANHTTKELVLKDFSMESDETRIRKAAHSMVASLAGNLAHVTCKEPLCGSIISQLRNSLQGLSVASELLEYAVQLVTNDNLDLGCALIEQAATEKAIQMIDGEIAQQLSIRRKQREGVGHAYFDAHLYTQGQMGVLPEALRPKPGRLSHSQQRVYEDFVLLPWQKQSIQNSNVASIGPVSSGSGGLLRGYDSASGQLNPSTYPSGVGNTGIGGVPHSIDLGPEEMESTKTKLHSASSIHSGISDGIGPHNFNKDAIIASFSSVSAMELFSVDPFNVSGASAQQLPSSSVLERLGSNIPEPILTTGDGLDMHQTVSEKMKQAGDNASASREDYNVLETMVPDLAGYCEQVSTLFASWHRVCELPGVNDAACAHYVLQLLQSGLMTGKKQVVFFWCLMELSVTHFHTTQPLSFLAIDIYAALVLSIMKFSPVDHESTKLSIFAKVMTVTVKFIHKDADEKQASFNPRPYFRLFINWLLDLSSLEPAFDGAFFQVLLTLAQAFHDLRPLKVPAFSFAWLELVSHRSFMPKMLTANAEKGWSNFQHLLVDLFQFMEPFLRNAELKKPVHFLYKGTLRVLLVLLQDFPQFLCDYHFSFCDLIPPSCIQMRNIILSAFPRNMSIPDPSTPNLKIDLLPEIKQSPCILSEVDAALRAKQIKGDVDEYLQTRQLGSSFLSELKKKLFLSPSDAARAGTRYNVHLINSLVLYVGMQAASKLQASQAQAMSSSVPLAVYFLGPASDIYQTLTTDLDTEGRYLFLNAIANQLRYPNNHTHYFSFILLYLFAESKQELIQEQITRVILERLIVNRPHPWGLLVTFIELIKNPRYNFWSKSFTRCAPDIEKLLQSALRACGDPKPGEKGALSNMH